MVNKPWAARLAFVSGMLLTQSFVRIGHGLVGARVGTAATHDDVHIRVYLKISISYV